MRKVETYLKEFNNKIIRIINSNNSFTSLYNYLELDKIKFNKTYDYEETLSRLLVSFFNLLIISFIYFTIYIMTFYFESM